MELFAARPVCALARCVDPPEVELPEGWRLVLDRGPYLLRSEVALLREHHADVLVTKDSGGGLTEAKLHAARQLGLPVLMVDRPVVPGVPSVASVDEAAAWVRERAGAG